MDGTACAYLLATRLLPVVGFSDCSSAKYQAMHAVKALHGLRLLHCDIRESNNLCICEAEQNCKVILIDLGQSRLHTRVGLPARAAADSAAVDLGLSRLHRRHLGNVTWKKLSDRDVSVVDLECMTAAAGCGHPLHLRKVKCDMHAAGLHPC